MSYLELLKLASPEAVIVVTALAVLAIGLASTRAFALCSAVATLGLVFAIGAVLVLPQNATLFGGMLVISPLNSLFKIICIVLAVFTMLMTPSEKSLRNHGEYLAIILLATIGLMLLVGSEELLMIFIGLELTGLSLYVMAAFDKTDVRSAEAGLKYFLFGSTASAFTLFGISFIYGMTGTTSLAAIGHKLAFAVSEPLLAVGIVMTLIGFAFKIAAAPFHLWAPDAYQGAPAPVGAFAVVAAVRRAAGADELLNFSGLARTSPLLAGCMAVFMLSLAGLPPLAGFFGKFYLFSIAVRAGGNYGLTWLVALALFGSLVSLYYYLIVLKVIFQTQGAERARQSSAAENGLARLTIAFAAAAVLFLGIAPQFLVARILAALP